MTRRRWIADEVSGGSAFLTGSHADHLVRVLRVRVGQEFDIATGDTVHLGRVTAVSGERVEFQLGEEVSSAATARITLLLAIFKFDRMEWAIEKCTELGVAKIIPVIALRSDAHLAAASAKRLERWNRLALQAAEQSRRPAPPEIATPMKFAEAIKLSSPLRVLLSETENQAMLRDVLSGSRQGEEILLAIGPEGGWTAEELDAFQKESWLSASLGGTILRAETAAIAATAIASAMLG